MAASPSISLIREAGYRALLVPHLTRHILGEARGSSLRAANLVYPLGIGWQSHFGEDATLDLWDPCQGVAQRDVHFALLRPLHPFHRPILVVEWRSDDRRRQ